MIDIPLHIKNHPDTMTMPAPPAKRLLAQRLLLPIHCQAILWDMDGVLIDSLGLDIRICNQLVEKHFGAACHLPDEFIRSIFALHPPAFWRRILEHLQENHGIVCPPETHAAILAHYETARVETAFDLLPGIAEILAEARETGLRMAVVSNNTTRDVHAILARSGILEPFDLVVGNDLEGFQKKPAPDGYLHAARQLGVTPEQCVVVEDSLLGLEAGFRAGCHTVAVTTGGTRFDILSGCGMASQVYSAFTPLELAIEAGEIRKKRIHTPNDFVSHMVEHIAWRLGMGIRLAWNNDQWTDLGRMLGATLAARPRQCDQAAALGMIDDGSTEIRIDMPVAHPGAEFQRTGNVDVAWFMGLRCEQAPSGRPMLELLTGLAQGMNAAIRIQLCSAEDPHHAWEGIYRTLGIALNRMLEPLPAPTPQRPEPKPLPTAAVTRFTIEEPTLTRCKGIRITAESELIITVDFSRSREHAFVFDVADSIRVGSLPVLLTSLADQAGFSLRVECHALALSSSHVVLEDTGLVLGRVLLEILKARMEATGVHGAGSSVQTPADMNAPIRVGLSVEGRKFLCLVPLHDSRETLRERFLVGQDVLHGIRSEDLDDFLDGLAGGMSASLVIHFHAIPDPEDGWPMIFQQLGAALRETFAINPQRKGMPPGVKGTLL
ncbi:MAG: HAD-IA family hydrolase [Magnetococcales bacterium]|nr:HAD-IA family hydrolase [Magnetococcales bacterium]